MGEDVAQPRVVTRLFLSADISGSTAYKQQRGVDDLKWPTPFIEFYRQFPTVFFRHWGEQQTKHDSPHPSECDEPQIWKAIGDELVMCQEIRSESAAACTVRAWTMAIQEFRNRKSFQEHRLGLKGAAWLATFPQPNFEVMIPRHLRDVNLTESPYPLTSNREALQSGLGTLDFLGPNIDIGFRIASRATNRKFPVSFELADVLSFTSDDGDHDIALRHDRDVILKGVHRDADYPFFWIDIGASKLDDAIDELHGLPRYDRSRVKDVAEAVYEDRSVSRPYLDKAKRAAFRSTELKRQLAEAAQLLRHEAEAPTPDTAGEIEVPGSDGPDVKAAIARILPEPPTPAAPRRRRRPTA